MKQYQTLSTLKMAVAGVSLAVLTASCADLLVGEDSFGESEKGSLAWHFAYSPSPDPDTRAGEEIPDTNAFLLTVKDASGKVLYDGTYGASPTSLLVSPGSYSVSARSCAFSTPAFSKPQYGDDQVVVVKKGETTRAALLCRQLNAGVRLKIASNFLTSYPSATLHLKASEGSLSYGYSEKRYAYFQPGPVSLLLSENGSDKTLFTRSMEAQEMLVLSVSAPSSGGSTGGSLSIGVDTLRHWSYESFVIGSGGGSSGGGSDPSDALSVTQARDEIGAEDVWVYGYIVGGDLSSSGTKMNTTAPFSSDTHLAIAVRSSVTDKASCMSVELKKGDVRTALNLKTHPENLGHQVFLKGDIVDSYYGIPGIKSVTEFVLK